MEKPPILQFAEFFFQIGFNNEQSIKSLACLEKGCPMSISMQVGLGLRTMESVDEALAKVNQPKQDFCDVAPKE